MLNEEQLEFLKRMASAPFDIQQCATTLQVDYVELKKQIDNPKTKEHEYYYSGKNKSYLELLEAIKKLANRGSHPAQLLLLNLHNKAK
jgi:hypothetical protein